MPLNNVLVSPIHNYYGAVAVKEEKGRFYIGLDDHNGCDWTEISKPFYDSFLSEFSETYEGDIFVWEISLKDGDWYWVFARTKKEAISLIREIHYEMSVKEFKAVWAPKIRKIPANEMLSCRQEDGEASKTARLWVVGESPGLFVSNTYDY